MRIDTDKTRQIPVVGLFLLLLSGCTGHKPVPLPNISLNRNPMDRYEITIQIENKVTSPQGIGGKVSYMVDNAEKCLPVDYTRAIGGVRPVLYREQSLTYERVSNHVFKTYIYEDAILNEDYYGLGVCDWGAQSVSAHIVIGSSTQIAGVTNKNIKSETPHIAFCPNNSQKMLVPDQSCISEERFKQRDSETKKNFYKIEILSKKITL